MHKKQVGRERKTANRQTVHAMAAVAPVAERRTVDESVRATTAQWAEPPHAVTTQCDHAVTTQ